MKFRRCSGLIVTALFCLNLLSCGIDTIVYLKSEPVSVSESPLSLIFHADNTSETNYYGLSLFYKIYSYEEDAKADYTNLMSRQNADNSVPGAYIESYLKGTLSYKSLVIDEKSANMPSLAKAIVPSTYYINIDFNDKPQLIITDTNTNMVKSKFSIKREETDSTTAEFLEFSVEPKSTDKDLKYNATYADTNTYYIQFFACSYGMNLASLESIYGDAVYLGRIILTSF